MPGSIQLSLNPFTLIGATTRSGLLTAPLLSRFATKSRLEYYNAQTLKRIIFCDQGILNVQIADEAAAEILPEAVPLPGIANGLLHAGHAICTGIGMTDKLILALPNMPSKHWMWMNTD